MAIVILRHLKEARAGMKSARLKKSIDYIFDINHDEAKTDGGIWVGGNAGSTPEAAYNSMMETKRIFDKESGRQGYHYMISFAKGEISPEKAFALAQEFCDRYLKDNFDYVYTIHTDRDHLHAHIIFNSVGYDGYKYRYEKGDWERDIMPIMNDICKKNGLSEISLEDLEEKRKEKPKDTKEPTVDYGVNWKTVIREDFDHVIEESDSYEEFLEKLQEIGYEITRTGYSKKWECEYFAIRTEGMERARRNYSLGKDYTIDKIKYRIENKDYIKQVRDNAMTHPVYRTLHYQIARKYHVRHIKIQRTYLLRIGCAYKTHYRWQKPYSQAWKYKKDLINMQKLIDRYNFLHENNIRSEEDLENKKTSVSQEKEALAYERRKAYRQKSSLESEGKIVQAEKKQEEINAMSQTLRILNRQLAMIKDIEKEADVEVPNEDLMVQPSTAMSKQKPEKNRENKKKHDEPQRR